MSTAGREMNMNSYPVVGDQILVKKWGNIYPGIVLGVKIPRVGTNARIRVFVSWKAGSKQNHTPFERRDWLPVVQNQEKFEQAHYKCAFLYTGQTMP